MKFELTFGDLNGTDQDRTDFVFPNLPPAGAVAKRGQGQLQVERGDDAHFVGEAATGGVDERLAGERVSAARVGPDPGPGGFVQRTLLEERTALVVEQKHGKGQVQRRHRVMHRSLEFRADGASGVVDENDVFFERVHAPNLFKPGEQQVNAG